MRLIRPLERNLDAIRPPSRVFHSPGPSTPPAEHLHADCRKCGELAANGGRCCGAGGLGGPSQRTPSCFTPILTLAGSVAG